MTVVLDASALLAYLQDEPGGEAVTLSYLRLVSCSASSFIVQYKVAKEFGR